MRLLATDPGFELRVGDIVENASGAQNVITGYDERGFYYFFIQGDVLHFHKNGTSPDPNTNPIIAIVGGITRPDSHYH